MLSCAAALAFAVSVLDRRSSLGADGDIPTMGQCCRRVPLLGSALTLVIARVCVRVRSVSVERQTCFQQ